jgi:hypothetical protein
MHTFYGGEMHSSAPFAHDTGNHQGRLSSAYLPRSTEPASWPHGFIACCATLCQSHTCCPVLTTLPGVVAAVFRKELTSHSVPLHLPLALCCCRYVQLNTDPGELPSDEYAFNTACGERIVSSPNSTAARSAAAVGADGKRIGLGGPASLQLRNTANGPAPASSLQPGRPA